jgi:hypothetical protein
MGHSISKIYIYLKSLCPPCISYDISSNILITDISSSVFVYDVVVEQPVEQPVEPSITTEPIIVTQPIIVTEPIIPNPFTPKSLDEILKQKYHITHKKAVCLMEEFHTLQAILNLSVEQLAECKCNGRKFGTMAPAIWNQLHSV